MRTPRWVRPCTRRRRSSRLRARRSMLCTTTVSPSRTKASSRSSSGRRVSLPDALSVNTLSTDLFELPFWVLVEAADADVTDALTVQGILLREMCQEEIYDP